MREVSRNCGCGDGAATGAIREGGPTGVTRLGHPHGRMTNVYVGFIGFAVSDLLSAWRTGDWQTFWDSASGVLRLVPLGLLGRRDTFVATQRASAAVFTAREAAIARNAELA